jgi:hypothetical protein
VAKLLGVTANVLGALGARRTRPHPARAYQLHRLQQLHNQYGEHCPSTSETDLPWLHLRDRVCSQAGSSFLIPYSQVRSLECCARNLATLAATLGSHQAQNCLENELCPQIPEALPTMDPHCQLRLVTIVQWSVLFGTEPKDEPFARVRRGAYIVTKAHRRLGTQLKTARLIPIHLKAAADQ